MHPSAPAWNKEPEFVQNICGRFSGLRRSQLDVEGSFISNSHLSRIRQRFSPCPKTCRSNQGVSLVMRWRAGFITLHPRSLIIFFEHSPSGRLWEFTSCGERWSSLTSTHWGPSCTNRAPSRSVGPSISRPRWLEPAALCCRQHLDDGQTSGGLTTGWHGAHWGDSFNRRPQREGRLTVCAQATANCTWRFRKDWHFSWTSVNCVLF